MLKIIQGIGRDGRHSELEAAFRLRHKIFVDEARWTDLRKPDGLERDEFDDEHAVHMLLYSGTDLIGYQRMLPTTRPYLLGAVYPQLCDEQLPSAPSIYEWTRFAVRPEFRGSGNSLGLAGAILVHGFVEWGLCRGVNAVVVELAPVQMLKFAQCHFRAHPLGIIQPIAGQDTIAVLAKFDGRTQRRLASILETSTSERAA